MGPGLRKFIQSWLINTLAVLLAVKIVKGIHYDKPLDLVAASLLLGILNAVLRPVIMFLALPLLILTLGLFMLVINALLLYFVARPDGSGAHEFSNNIAAHESAAARYHRGLHK